MDGAGFTNGAIARYLSLPNKDRFLLLGPWDHGARVNVSPWRDSIEPTFSVLAETLRFFDTYLLHLGTGLEREAPIHYYVMHAEEWRAAHQWPPEEEMNTFYLSTGRALTPSPGAMEAKDSFKVDATAGAGTNSRYERLAAVDTREYYGDWQDRSAALLSYTSDPLAADAEISGHPVLTLWLSSSESDAAMHVYLSEVESDGRCRYVTEGVLRALHRKESPAPRHEAWTWPYHSFTRRDASPLPIDTPTCLRFALLPTAWRFARGSRIRLSIAGADCDHYVQVPHGRPPVLSIHTGGDHTSMLELPWKSRSPL
jgi:putative CocE/NonD family hydrolase